MNTHKVIDEMYHEDEDGGNTAMVGSMDECEEFLREQHYPIGMRIVPLIKDELKIYNSIS